MNIKELHITNVEEINDNVLLTLASGDTVRMSDEKYKSMITSGLDEMKDGMFPDMMTECKYCDCVLPVGRHVALDSVRTVRMESTEQLDDQFVDILIVKRVGYDRNEDYLEMGKYYLETTDSEMYQGYTAINYCPMCGRKLGD